MKTSSYFLLLGGATWVSAEPLRRKCGYYGSGSTFGPGTTTSVSFTTSSTTSNSVTGSSITASEVALTCTDVADVVAQLQGIGAAATSFCVEHQGLLIQTTTQTITHDDVLVTNTVVVTEAGPTTTVTPPVVTKSSTITVTVTTTQFNQESISVTTTENEESTETSTPPALVTVVSTGTVPAYLTMTTTAPVKRAQVTDVPALSSLLDKLDSRHVNAACLCLDISATNTVTTILPQSTETTQTTLTVVDAGSTETATTLTTTAFDSATTTATTEITMTTTIIAATVTVMSTTTTTILAPIATQTQLPRAVCQNLGDQARVDLGINNPPAGSSARNNFGPYTLKTCCELCYDTSGCYMAYIAVSKPQPGQEVYNNCYLYYFPGPAAPGICPAQYNVMSAGKRILPPDHYVIPGPCLIVDA